MADVKISDLPAAGAITGAELVPVVQGGVTSQSTVDAIKNGAVKVYRALLTQSGTSAPTAVVLENTMGGTVVWAYSAVGDYTATLTGAFPSVDKVWLGIATLSDKGFSIGYWVDVNTVEFQTWTSAGAAANAMLYSSGVEILVYP